MVDSAKGKAEDVRAGFDTLRVLVDAVDTQLGFFIREKGMFGPYRELIRSHALDIQTMLGVILHEVCDMEKEQGELVRMLIHQRTETEEEAAYMTTAQMRYFIAVAECLSVTEAADRLYLSQPALSRHIAQM